MSSKPQTEIPMSAEGVAYNLAELKARATAANALFPQYRGYHLSPDWCLVRIGRDVNTKLGAAFMKGELALARLCPADAYGPECWEAWSQSNRIHTRINPAWATQVVPGDLS